MNLQGFKTSKILLAAACAASLMTLGACSSDSSSRSATPTGGVVTPPPPPPANLTSAVVLTVIDSSTGLPLTGTVTVTPTGENALQITDADGNRGPWTVTGGSLAVIAKGLAPISATLVVSADDYFNGSASFTITENTVLSKLARLTPKAATPGTGVQAATGNVSTDFLIGRTTSSLVVGTSGAGDPIAAGASVKVTIPANTGLFDENGQPFVDSDLTMDVAFFPNDANGAAAPGQSPLYSFPGGLGNIQMSETSTIDHGFADGGSFISGGLIAIEFYDENGNLVTEFDPPVQISAQVPATTVNPETGLPVAANDTIGVWSYDENTGEWNYETEATFGAVDPVTNTIQVDFEIAHLSYWNLDWYTGDFCDVTIDVTDAAGQPAADNWLKAELRRSGGGWVNAGSVTNGSLELSELLSGEAVDLKLMETNGNELYTESVTDMCDLTTSVSVPANPLQQVSVEVNPQLVCAANTGRETAETPAFVYITEDNATLPSLILEYAPLDAASNTTFQLKYGEPYTFTASTTQDVQAANGDGVVLPSGSEAKASAVQALPGLVVDLDFPINCFSATGATGGTN